MWESKYLEEICEIKGGKRLPAGHVLTTIPTKHLYMRAQDINGGKITFTQKQYISDETYEKIKRYTVKEGDIVLTIAGKIGDTGYISFELSGANLTENAVKLIAKKDIVHPKYLHYSLSINHMKSYFEQVAAGAAQPKLGLYKIKKAKIPLPPLPTQKKIAGILSAYDGLIENNLRRIKLLEEMAQITYEEWFVRLRFPDHTTTPINKATSLPEGWKIVKLREVLKLNYGKALKADTRIQGSIPVYGSSGIVGMHKFALVDEMGIIVGRKGNVGSVFWSHGSFYPIDTVYFVTSLHELHFLYYALKNSKFDNSDAAVPGLNRDAAYAVEITLPPKNIEKQFADLVEQNFLTIQLFEEQNQRLREARNILLPRLMTGVIDAEKYQPENFLK